MMLLLVLLCLCSFCASEGVIPALLGKAVLNDRVCDPAMVSSKSGSSIPYTGFRVTRDFVRSTKEAKYEVHLYFCKNGDLIMDLCSEAVGKRDFPWQTHFCNEELAICFKLARRKTFSQRTVPLFFPGTFVGGLFQTDQSRLNYVPLQPLIYESPTNQWVEVKSTGVIAYHIPLFYTPDIYHHRRPTDNNWSKYIDPMEKYNLTKESRNSLRVWNDRILSKLGG